jgi:hypothetical protein
MSLTYEERNPPISSLVGKTIAAIERNADSVKFALESGEVYELSHQQDCCESVGIEDVTGNLEDLVGAPLLMADESSSNDWPVGTPKPEYEPESFTWTFYKFATIKGYVDIRFLGESNGYYGESAELCRIK